MKITFLKKLKKIDRNYYAIIGFWLSWKIVVTFIAYLGIVFFSPHMRDHTFEQNIYRVWNWWDGGFFNGIAATGYAEPGPGPHTYLIRSAFFPLFPILIRGLSLVFGGNIELAQYITVSLLFLVWIVILYYLLKNFIYSNKPKVALGACILAIVFPYNLFFLAGYSESLFMVIVILFFIALYKKRPILAAICVAFAAVTRFVGVGLLIILAIDILLTNKKWLDRLKILIPSTLISFSLTFLYSLFLQLKYGHWNWYLIVEDQWGRKFTLNLFSRYFEIIKNNIIGTDHYSILFVNDLFSLVLLFLALAVATFCLIHHRRFLYFGLFILIILAPAIFSGSIMSMNRYTIVCFPVYFIIAEFMENKAIPLVLLASPSAAIQSVLILAFTSAGRFIG